MLPADIVPELVSLHARGLSTAQIFREVSKDFPNISYKKVWRNVKKIITATTSRKRGRSRKVGNGLFSKAQEIISTSYKQNSSITATRVRHLLIDAGISYSCSQIKRIRRQLGFVRTTTKYVHRIRNENKEKRLHFCRNALSSRDFFLDVIFTDESTFQLENSTKFCYVKEGDYYSRMRSRSKHPAKLHVWGGISARGTTQLAIFNGTFRMDSRAYMTIIKQVYLPFVRNRYGGMARLAQDNHPAHKSRYTMEKLREENVDLIEWPAESPDLNPIELVWGLIKNYLREQQPKTIEEMKTCIENYWNNITIETCQRYVKGIQKKMRAVVECRGSNINETI